MAVKASDWPQVRAVFEHALTLPSAKGPDDVAPACGSREDVREQVERMLSSHHQASDFLETPAAAAVAGLTPAATLEGSQIGPYQLGARIGLGGMGEVY